MHISNKYGAGRSVLALIDGLLKRGVQCYCILPEPGPLVQELISRGAGCSILRLPRWVSEKQNLPLAALRLTVNFIVVFLVAMKALVWRADLLFSTSSVIPAGGIAAFFCHIPHVWQIREFVEEDYQMKFDLGGDRTRKLINRLSTNIIFVSEVLSLKYAPFLTEGKGLTIHNEISLDETELSNKYPHTFPTVATLVGKIHPGKGQQEAVLAISQLKEEGIDLQLNIVGDGDSEHTDKLWDLVKTKGVEDRVIFFGFVSSPSAVVRASDLILVCSRSGALDRVVIEGMLCGVPVIVARGGGNREVVIDRSTGLLYTPSDYHDLAQKIRLLLENVQLAGQIANNGRKWATEEFDGIRCSERVFMVLEEAIGRR